MIDHASFGCSKIDDAVDLYVKLLSPLGYSLTRAYPDGSASFGLSGAQIFWLYQKSGDHLAGVGSHLAFAAAAPEQVDLFHSTAVEEGLEIVRPAGRRPEISESYYGAVIRDRDGNMVEAVAYS